jgi:hypothetical protein
MIKDEVIIEECFAHHFHSIDVVGIYTGLLIVL